MIRYQIPDGLPSKVQTVGKIRDNHIVVKAICVKCNAEFKVDLETIIEVRGEDYSLINAKGGCRAFSCDGLCYFAYPLTFDTWVPLVTQNTPTKPRTPPMHLGAAHIPMATISVEESVARDKKLKAIAAERDAGKQPWFPKGGKRPRRR